MDDRKSTISFLGIGVGAVALMLALVHFWAGPFSPKPSLEQVVAEKAVSIREATVAALKGEVAYSHSSKNYDTDWVVSLATAILGGMAVILAVMGVALKEPVRVAGGAAVLGVAAIAFQFAVLALAALVVVILVSAVLGALGVG
ncbi:hypothetical protein ACFSB1_12130 [Halopseudomonas phragmitis]|uniref:Uncharacterized protein n=1 Tax=Halopseudomonas phragmitis TaxID=1931241 RepID=A0A1V0B0F2_9GAMM|nr:hypothetical protein [Halopseudomonas phragmitis]AQZ93409.1 hypothetical protein BVH74_00890 [Halopseudomonas phragmitis]